MWPQRSERAPQGSHAGAKGFSISRNQVRQSGKRIPAEGTASPNALWQDGVWGILGEGVWPDQNEGKGGEVGGVFQ